MIELKQIPVIEYSGIEKIGADVKASIDSLNLENQIVTTDTVKAVKGIRADLNKEFKILEEKRKLIKSAVAKPYQDFEQKYKELISVRYTEADALLKEKIVRFETQIKEAKKEEIKTYFVELCQSKEIDFLAFERLGINVTLTISMKKLKEEVRKEVDEIHENLKLIDVLPEDVKFKDDVFIEYKKTLNINHSLQVVQDRRKQAEILEQKRKEQEAKKVVKEVEKVEPKTTPLPAPKVEQKEERLEATFTVKGTLEQLKGLKAYILENKIELIK